MKYLKFTNGDQMPAIGLGTWKSKSGEVFEAVIEAIKAGYRHIDCAAIYGNEAEVGQAIEKVVADGILKRAQLWITSKLWNDAHKQDQVEPALRATLKDLNLEYLDLYLVHWPVALKNGVRFPKGPQDFLTLDQAPLSETWKAMEGCYHKGLAKHIGVSNFNQEKIAHLMGSAEVRPEMNQVELHPYLPQTELLAYCKSNGIHMTAYSPLGSRDRPEGAKKQDEPSLFDDPTIKKIADKHNASPAQILISWAVHRGTAVIPKSVNPDHIRDNLKAAGVALDPSDMQNINAIDHNYRFIDGSLWAIEGAPYSLAGLWGKK